MIDIPQLTEKYRKGENIIHYLDQNHHLELSREEMISISYDLQAGSYTTYAAKNQELIDKMTSAMAKVLDQYAFSSIMEVGCGEATTLANVLGKLKNKATTFMGFDISLSRLLHAQRYMRDLGVQNDGYFFLANLFTIPLCSHSVDVVYTAHSLEPNGGREDEAIREVCRVTKNYCFLFEPYFEKAGEEGQARMTKHGYIKGIEKTIQKIGHKLVEARLFDYCYNPLNPTGLFVIEINKNAQEDAPFVEQCPKSQFPLKRKGNLMFSERGGYCYPIIENIPCLLKENGILLTQPELLNRELT